MDQDFFPLVIGLTLSVCLLAYLARNRLPRLAEVVGWSSGIMASLTFVAMVTIDAFQPELADFLQHLAMPAPAVRAWHQPDGARLCRCVRHAGI